MNELKKKNDEKEKTNQTECDEKTLTMAVYLYMAVQYTKRYVNNPVQKCT